MRVLVAMGIAGIALILAACADSEETPSPTTSPTVAATVTTTAAAEATILAEEGEPEKVPPCCPSPRVFGGDIELYGSDFRLPIKADFYFREKIQSYKLVRIDEQSIDGAECRENQPLRMGAGHHILLLVDVRWEKTYQLIPYESDDCSGPAIRSYPYPLTFFGRGLLEDYSGRLITDVEPYPVIPNDPLSPPGRLRVVGIDCLEVRSAPITDAKVLECVPEGELLWTSDDDEEWNVGGLSWRQVKRSRDGRTEYADIRYLQGADASTRGPFRQSSKSNFLVVHGVEECLEVRAGPGLHTEIVDCVSEGTGLRSQRNGVSADGTTWRPLEWDGQWVWGDKRFLEGYPSHPYALAVGELSAPAMEVPYDVALLAFVRIYQESGYGPVHPAEMIRIHRGPDGELVRETIFTPEQVADSKYVHGAIATDDLSRIVVAAGIALYQSLDGGVTWNHLDNLEKVWPRFRLTFLPGENDGDPEQVLSIVWSIHSAEHDTIFTLHPSGEREVLPWGKPWSMSQLWQRQEMAKIEEGSPLPSLIATDDNFSPYSWFSEGKLIGSARFSQVALTRGGVVENGPVAACCYYPERPWPAVYDLETGLIHALALPGILQFGEHLWPFVGLQRGPFLRVSLPGDCKNVRAEPGLDAEILDCAAEGVLLRDLGEQAEHGGRTWLKVRTPAEIEGWSSSRYLQ